MTAQKQNNYDNYNISDIPQNIETEQFALSCLMLEGAAQGGRMDSAADVLRAEDFTMPAHQRIFSALLLVRERGAELDLALLRTELVQRNWLEEAGDVPYLMTLFDLMPSPANLPFYLEDIRKMAKRRRLITVSAQIRGGALDPETEPDEAAIRAENLLLEATDNAPGKKPLWTSAGDASADYLTRLAERVKSGNVGLSGIPTGLRNVDLMLGGLEPKTLNILAGRPSMGKSAAGFTVAKNVAEAGYTVGVFLLEGSESIVSSRLLSQIAQVNSRRMQQARLSREELHALQEAHRHLESLPLHFDDSHGLTVADLRSRLRRLKATRGALDLVVVDYLQIMRGDSKRSQGDKRVEVMEIAQGLKAIAKEFEIPVIAVAQLNRGVERREDKRPLMSDLGESGQIEQEADTISFLYRASYYAPKEEGEGKSAGDVDEVEWIVAKNKEGAQGFTKVGFRPAFTQFVDLEVNRDSGF